MFSPYYAERAPGRIRHETGFSSAGNTESLNSLRTCKILIFRIVISFTSLLITTRLLESRKFITESQVLANQSIARRPKAEPRQMLGMKRLYHMRTFLGSRFADTQRTADDSRKLRRCYLFAPKSIGNQSNDDKPATNTRKPSFP